MLNTYSLLRFLPVLHQWTSVNANSFLSDTLIRKDQVQSVLEHRPVDVSECENTQPTGPIDTTMCDYETVESVNGDLFSNVHELVKMPFFKYFQVDLYRECPFWDDQGSCNNPGCAITTVDESQVPLKWRAKVLSQVDGLVDDRHELPGCYYRDSDFCWLDDNTEGDYYDLTLVPERFTGYSGPEAHRIWRTIYEENCFGLSEFNIMDGAAPAPVSLPDTMTDVLRSGEGTENEQCLEKRVYYKVISGLHASISTHICAEYLNQTTGEWGPNLQCFVNRIASHPERLQYIYFNTVLMLRAVARLGPYLSAYDYCSTGTEKDDVETKEILSKVISIAQKAGQFDESALFRGENANILKEEFKVHFRNVTRIMDCVGCDKCRLWGKIQTTGIATALKVLFELDEKALNPHANANLLQRSEVVALLNTLHRFSESLEAVNKFRLIWSGMNPTESEQVILEAEKAVTSIPRTPPSVGPRIPRKIFKEVRVRFASFIQLENSRVRNTNIARQPFSHATLFVPPVISGSFYVVLAEMILPDTEGQQNGKLDSYVAGPSVVRVPDRAIGRTSLLPDYETSQAQHNPSSPNSSSVSFRKYSLHHTVDSRFWRATLYALAIYIGLTIIIGVPLLVTKISHKHKTGPPPWEKGSDDASLSSPLEMMNTGMFTMSSSVRCDRWNSTLNENGLYKSSASYSLDPSGSFSIRSSAWNTDENMQTEVTGVLIVDINPDPSVTTAIFYLTTVSSTLEIRDKCRICFSSDIDSDNRGLSLYIPANLTAHEFLSFEITLLFPQSSSPIQIDNLVTYLPMFTQSIASISPQVILSKLVLEGMRLGIGVGSVWADQINVKNLIGPISGSFNATNLLKLDTVKGSISANLTVVQGPGRKGPTFFSLDTGESEITADIVLLSPISTTSSRNFIGHVKNFDGPIMLKVTHDESTPPVPLDLRVQNNQAPCNISLDAKFSGNYDVATKLALATVVWDSTLDDYTGTGQRQILPSVDTESQKHGWVGWGNRPSHFDPRKQSQVMLVSSLSPVSLTLGS
ncbi:hypothetical protein D9757_000769 [Collybiopsis confluens]|uniref:Uncharacterized protein n=1 Tax=Collybiopsis confluens TaxID=2823264 RepID=A0A8H5I1C3_9AGAR|nr:hypothetical protein D9757_000769 [Collybiopsis confluens]